MLKTITILLLSYNLMHAQELKFTKILDQDISIRAIVVDGDKVWFSGTQSQLGYVNFNNPKDTKIITLSEKKMQFRTLAQDQSYLYTINIESPAQFFKIDKTLLSPEIFYTDNDAHAFYDALILNENKFYSFSDPEENLGMKLISFRLDTPTYEMKNLGKNIILSKGEAAFAASNSNIVASSKYIWLATGGTKSNIYRWDKRKETMDIFPTHIVQGKTTQGIYAIDFYHKQFGIAVGGDYTDQKNNRNNIATTQNGGKTWSVQASGKNAGYSTCVKIKPGSKGKEIITVGDQHISYSNDYGKSWTVISEEKDLYTCVWVGENQLIFAGKNKILKAKLNIK